MILISRLTQVVRPFLEIGFRFHSTSTPLKFYTLQILLFISFSFSIAASPLLLHCLLSLLHLNCLPFFHFFLSGYNVKRSDVTLIDSYLEDIPQGAKERVESNALPIDFPSDLIAPKLFICHSKYQTSV